MSTYVGGLRARLVHDSIYYMLYSALDDLGWFEEEDSRLPLRFVSEPQPPDVEVPLNTIALADEDETTEEIELGSGLHELSWNFYVDFYAENDAIGVHLIRDVRDILQGRMPSIGRSRPTVQVYDYTQATPTVIFTVDIEDVRTDKARDFPHPWLRFWRTCAFTVIDTYDNENDDA